jgi:hypothetical protein
MCSFRPSDVSSESDSDVAGAEDSCILLRPFRRCYEVSAVRFGPRLDWHASKHGFAQLSQLS